MNFIGSNTAKPNDRLWTVVGVANLLLKITLWKFACLQVRERVSANCDQEQ